MAEAFRTWSPAKNRPLQRLWKALTGDTLTAAPSWNAYTDGVKLRDAFVHRAAAVPKEQAETFVTAAEQLMDHVVNVLAVAPRHWPD